MHRLCELANSVSHIVGKNVKRKNKSTDGHAGIKNKIHQFKKKQNGINRVSDHVAPIRNLLSKQTTVCHCC